VLESKVYQLKQKKLVLYQPLANCNCFGGVQNKQGAKGKKATSDPVKQLTVLNTMQTQSILSISGDQSGSLLSRALIKELLRTKCEHTHPLRLLVSAKNCS